MAVTFCFHNAKHVFRVLFRLFPTRGVKLDHEVRSDARAGPAFVQIPGNRCHPSLIATAISDQDDIFKTMNPEAFGNVDKEGVIGLVPHCECPGEMHRSRGWIDAALGNEWNNRGT